MSKKEWTKAPCQRCGKTPRYDYAGYCMDCADDLGIREVVAPRPGQQPDKAQIESAPDRTTDDRAR